MLLDTFIIKACRLLPFTYIGLFRKALGKVLNHKKATVLDLGCGTGAATERLGLPKSFQITGVDIFKPYLYLAEKLGIYKRLINKDVRKLRFSQRFDVVIISHVLEHMTKKEGIKLIRDIEKIANKKIIIAMPVGYLPQEEYDGNSYQIHKSSWNIEEMEKLGFRVYGQGLKLLWGNDNVISKYGFFGNILFVVSAICFPVLLIWPGLGTYMICYKDIG